MFISMMCMQIACISHIPKCYYGSCWYESYRRKEGNVLFNDALNTFYLRLYGVRHMVKDHAPTTELHLSLPTSREYVHHAVDICNYRVYVG